MKIRRLHIGGSRTIEKARKGDRNAQRELWEQHAPAVLATCRQYLSNLPEAQDAMSDSFFTAFTSMDKYRGDGPFPAWLRRIAVRKCLDRLRARKDYKVAWNEDIMGEEIQEEVAASMEMEELQSIIDQLPAGFRSVFLLYCVEGYTHQDIAYALDISENTSKSQLSRARKQLQASWNNLQSMTS